MTSSQPMALRESRLVIDGAVAEFSHQRPASRNAMSMELRRDYAEMLDILDADRGVRALIITGSGGSFCAGGDVKGMHERLQSDDPEINSPAATRRRLEDSQRWLRRLRELDLPVIAAVDGAAYGAGFSLALQADFVVASTRAAFCMSFARVGALPDFGAFYTLPRLIGLAHAKELMLTARRVGAAEAQALGFVHQIHEPDALLPQAHALARRLAKGPREVLGHTKSLLNRSFETDYAGMADFEACAQAVCMAAPYHAEAVARFTSGQPAAYDWDRDASGAP